MKTMGILCRNASGIIGKIQMPLVDMRINLHGFNGRHLWRFGFFTLLTQK
jgi:hypothetical protein